MPIIVVSFKNKPAQTWTANGAHKRLAWQVQLGCGSLSIRTPVSLLANKLDVRSILHGHVSLADANNSYIIQKNLMSH